MLACSTQCTWFSFKPVKQFIFTILYILFCAIRHDCFLWWHTCLSIRAAVVLHSIYIYAVSNLTNNCLCRYFIWNNYGLLVGSETQFTISVRSQHNKATATQYQNETVINKMLFHPKFVTQIFPLRDLHILYISTAEV
jgi:hypothetical protein